MSLLGRWASPIPIQRAKDLVAGGARLTGAQVRTVARRLLKCFDPVAVAGTTLSAADAIFLLAHYAEFLLREGRRPDHVQIRRTLGPVEALLTHTQPVALKRQNILFGARQVVHHVNTTGRIPHAVRAHHTDCGPGELLLALARSIAAPELPDSVTVEPTPGVPECAAMDCFARATAGSTVAPPGYQPDQVHLQGRLQSWSYRPAVRP